MEENDATTPVERSDLSRAFSEDGALKTHVGGQALLEGIMMRGKHNWAVAVREPSGNIYIEEHDLQGPKRNGWASWPFVRGCFAFADSLVLGFKALTIATEHAFIDEEPESTTTANTTDRNEAHCETTEDRLPVSSTTHTVKEPNLDEGSAEEITICTIEEEDSTKADPILGSGGIAVSLILGLVLGIVLFVVAPAFITNLIVGDYGERTLVWNIVDGLIRIAIFIFYIWLIGRMSDIQRMFGYHGAEHKTIHCYEHGLPLTPKNALKFPRLHVRCGTAFLIMVMILAIFIYTVLPIDALVSALGVIDGAQKLALVIVVRILLMPLIAGIAYEITVRWAGNHPENPLVKAVLWPGLQMQYLTTREPDAEQIECAIAAMQQVLLREELEEQQAQNEHAKQKSA